VRSGDAGTFGLAPVLSCRTHVDQRDTLVRERAWTSLSTTEVFAASSWWPGARGPALTQLMTASAGTSREGARSRAPMHRRGPLGPRTDTGGTALPGAGADAINAARRPTVRSPLVTWLPRTRWRQAAGTWSPHARTATVAEESKHSAAVRPVVVVGPPEYRAKNPSKALAGGQVPRSIRSSMKLVEP